MIAWVIERLIDLLGPLGVCHLCMARIDTAAREVVHIPLKPRVEFDFGESEHAGLAT